jgi:hypothetical protein
MTECKLVGGLEPSHAEAISRNPTGTRLLK